MLVPSHHPFDDKQPPKKAVFAVHLHPYGHVNDPRFFTIYIA
ncbi:MAG TPA: hypothetical protein VE170_08120 [Candidatus Limnocylindria bacterium]|nr:hypothetical protein [Candidatus Limnocylindria bacterium]